MIERLAGIPAEVDIGSEFRYRDAVVGPETLVVALSQSGETADTLGAVKAARAKGAPIVAITNVVGSALAREATGVALHPRRARDRRRLHQDLHRDPAWPATCSASGSGRRRGTLLAEDGRKHIQGLLELPRLMEQTLEIENAVADLARELSRTELPLPGPRDQLPARARGRAQAEGALLHPRRGLPGRRDEARAHRADRRRHAGGRAGPAGRRPTTA